MSILSVARLIGAIGCLAIALPPASHAAQQEVGSCYDSVPMDGVDIPALDRELFVIVDQTLELEKPLQEQTYQKILKFAGPGARVVIVAFSAYVANRYTDVLFDGVIDNKLTDKQRYSISKKLLATLDHCHKVQEDTVRNMAGATLIETFKTSSAKLPNTELVGNLALLSSNVMATARTSNRYVLLVSDMLEHSTITSFYSQNRVRQIDPKAEMEKVRRAGIAANFNDATIYVLGAGYSPQGNYRAVTQMRAIEAFWSLYFNAANARLREFGAPSLVAEIGK
jgi:hypothetical protein